MRKALKAFLLLYIIGQSSLAQQTTIYPKKGEIAFVGEAKVVDSAVYQKSIDHFRNFMATALKAKFMKEKNESIDTNRLNQVIEDLKEIPFETLFLDVKEQQSKHTYRDTIIMTSSINPDIDRNIHIKKAMIFMDGLAAVTEMPYEYSKTTNRSVAEFKNERRRIQGYDCFKVILKYKAGDTADIDDEFSALLAEEENEEELWVSELIQSLYHPIEKDKGILSKYYPLEIIKRNNMTKGLEVAYKVTSISLSN